MKKVWGGGVHYHATAIHAFTHMYMYTYMYMYMYVYMYL